MGVKSSKSSRRWPLDRAASAPTLGSCRPAETLCPRAAKSVESLPECPATPGREEPPPTLLTLSDRDTFTRADASLAGTEPSRSPISPSLNTRAKPVASGDPKPSCAEGSSPDLESPLEGAGGSCVSSAGARAGGAAALLPSSGLELSHKGPESPEELGMEQSLDEQLKTIRPQEKLNFSWDGAQRPDCAPHKLPGTEALMEVTDQAFFAADSQGGEQDARLSAVEAPCSVMEAEPPKPGFSLSADPLPAREVRQSGGITLESTEVSANVGLSGPPPLPPPEGPLSRPGEEEASPSLASALKELHQLLVASYRRASWDGSLRQPGALPDEGAAGEEELLEGERQEHRGRDVQGVELSPPEGLPGCVCSDPSTGGQFPGAGAEEGQERLGWPGQGAPVFRQPLELDPGSPTVLRREPLGGECSEASPRCLPAAQRAGGEAVEQVQPPPVSSSPEQPEAPHPACPETDSATPQPPALPTSADLGRIVRAGFAPQEASEALERAGGDVDLALLLLLAKKIVVPT